MMLKNQLKLIVLKKLEDNSLSGYDLIKEIYSSTGTWKPSFGSMYPLLKELHINKLVTVKTQDRKKIYSITKKGKKTLSEALATSQNIIEVMANEFKMMESICSVQEKRQLDTVIKKIHSDPSLFRGYTEEMDKFQRLIMRFITDPKYKKKEDQIKTVLDDTIKKLQKI